MLRSRRTYTGDFKQQAVHMIEKEGEKIIRASIALGVPVPTLNKWLKEYRSGLPLKTTGKRPKKAMLLSIKKASSKAALSKKTASKKIASKKAKPVVKKAKAVAKKAKAVVKKAKPVAKKAKATVVAKKIKGTIKKPVVRLMGGVKRPSKKSASAALGKSVTKLVKSVQPKRKGKKVGRKVAIISKVSVSKMAKNAKSARQGR